MAAAKAAIRTSRDSLHEQELKRITDAKCKRNDENQRKNDLEGHDKVKFLKNSRLKPKAMMSLASQGKKQLDRVLKPKRGPLLGIKHIWWTVWKNTTMSDEEGVL